MKFKKKSVLVVEYNSETYKKYDGLLNGRLGEICEKNKVGDYKEEASVSISYPVENSELMAMEVFSLGNSATTHSIREMGGRMVKKYRTSVKNIYFDAEFTSTATLIYEGARLAAYSFDKYKSKKSKSTKIHMLCEYDSNVSRSVNFARDLVSEPGNFLHPEKYAEIVDETFSQMGCKVKIYSEFELEEMGFDLLLSVGQGSNYMSQVAVIEWMPNDDQDPLVFVGKGVTFDTGGISLKPSAGMADMKFDMGGSAAVVGALHAIVKNKVNRNVIGIVGLVENAIDADSVKPGDIVKSLSGKTVENLNTDAEGRLVLADLLTHVQSKYTPEIIVDVATLTGAILVSLGHEMAGLFSNSAELSTHICDAGEEVGEHYWRMPMGEKWNKMINSDIADVKNISSGRYGGSTTAAEFLYRFVDKKIPWAHLDIAGMAWDDSGSDTTPKGATGFGVQTLYNLAADDERQYGIDKNMKY